MIKLVFVSLVFASLAAGEQFLTVERESPNVNECLEGVKSCFKVKVNFDVLSRSDLLELPEHLSVKKLSVQEYDDFYSVSYGQDDAVTGIMVYAKDLKWVSGDIKDLASGRHFALKPCEDGDGCYVWKEIDTSVWEQMDKNRKVMIPEDAGLSRTESLKQKMLLKRGETERQNTVVTVTIYVTPQVKSFYGTNLNAFISQIISETNQGYVNSGVPITLRLKCLVTSTLQDTSFTSTDALLRAFTPTSSANFRAMRKDADIAVLLTTLQDNCGIAWFNVISNRQTFGVVSRSCATGYFSFGHEIAHMYGCYHNEEQGVNPSYSYGYGFLMRPPLNSGYRTIMAYTATGYANRINYYSNPAKYFSAIPTGTASKNNNAKVLTDRRFQMAAVSSETLTCA